MKRIPPAPEAAFGRLTTAITAYGLDLAVGMIVERVGTLLTSSGTQLSTSERRRLTLARAALRTAQAHFGVLLSPRDDLGAEPSALDEEEG